jgi:O-antigen/teichoic acid export membrane protein
MKGLGMEVSGPPVEPGRGSGPTDTLRTRLLTPGSFARSVLTLTTGTTLANLVPIVTAPILSRLYGPAEFGLFALYAGVAALLGVAATGRYEMAIVLPAEDGDAFELLGLSLLLAGATAVLAAIVVGLFQASLLTALSAPALGGWVALLPLGVLLMGTMQAFVNWLNRRRAYRRIAEGRIVQALATAALAIALAGAGHGAGGLIVSAVAGQALATAVLAVVVWSGVRGAGLRVSRAGMRRVARRYREFPRVNALHAVLDNLASSATLVLLAHAFGAVVVGHWSLVMRVLTAPVTFIGSAISQVFFQRAAEARHQGGDLRALVRSLLRRTVWLALPGALLLLLAGPVLFRAVFGPEWAPAGRYAQILSPYMFFVFVASPLAFLPFVLDRQWQSFLLSTTGNALFLGAIAVGGATRRPELGFVTLSVVVSAYYVVYIGWMLHIAGRPPGRTT